MAWISKCRRNRVHPAFLRPRIWKISLIVCLYYASIPMLKVAKICTAQTFNRRVTSLQISLYLRESSCRVCNYRTLSHMKFYRLKSSKVQVLANAYQGVLVCFHLWVCFNSRTASLNSVALHHTAASIPELSHDCLHDFWAENIPLLHKCHEPDLQSCSTTIWVLHKNKVLKTAY